MHLIQKRGKENSTAFWIDAEFFSMNISSMLGPPVLLQIFHAILLFWWPHADFTWIPMPTSSVFPFSDVKHVDRWRHFEIPQLCILFRNVLVSSGILISISSTRTNIDWGEPFKYWNGVTKLTKKQVCDPNLNPSKKKIFFQFPTSKISMSHGPKVHTLSWKPYGIWVVGW